MAWLHGNMVNTLPYGFRVTGRHYGDLVTVDCWTVLLGGLDDSVTW